MADTMAQPTPGLEVTGPDDTMELSSELGTQAHDDIDVDIDLTGSGMKSPAHPDDYMIEDYKLEVDMDTTLMDNDMNHDDDVMVDDSKVQDDLVVDNVVPDEELRDISDFGQDDFEPETNENDSQQVEAELNNAVHEYNASVAGFEQPVDQNIDEPQPDEDLIDYSDEEDNSTLNQVQSAADAQDISYQAPVHGASANEAKATAVYAATDESLSIKQSGGPEEHRTGLGKPQESTDPVSSQERNGFFNNQALLEDVQENNFQHGTGSVSPSKRQSSGSVADAEQVPGQNFNLNPHSEDNPVGAEDSHYHESRVLEAEKGQTGGLLPPAITTDEDFNSGNLNTTTDQTGEANHDESDENGGENAPNEAGHTENASAENGDDQRFDPLPISTIVSYECSDYSLFASGEEVEDNTAFFLSDESFANSSIHDILKECRVVLGESISDQSELEIDIPDLGLCINESCVYALTTSLRQVLDVYVNLVKLDGTQDLQPLYIIMTAKISFANRLANLVQAANSGKGLSQLDFLQVSGSYDENSTRYETAGVDEGGSHQADTQNQDWAQNYLSPSLRAQGEAKEYAQERDIGEIPNSRDGGKASGIPAVSSNGRTPENSTHNHSLGVENSPTATLRNSTDSGHASGLNSRVPEAEVGETNQVEAETEFNDFQDLLDDGQEAFESLETEHGPDQSSESHSLDKNSIGHELQTGLGGVTESENVADEENDQEFTGDSGDQNGGFDFDGNDDYPVGTDTNGLDMGNENAEEFFLFDEDTTAVDSGDHEAEAIQKFDDVRDQSAMPPTQRMKDTQAGDNVHYEQAQAQDDANDDIFDEIDFNDEDEVPEFLDDQVSGTKTQEASPKLKAKRSWDEHNDDSSKDADEHDPKRLRS